MKHGDAIDLFVLRGARLLPGFHEAPNAEARFDEHVQIWRWRASGAPLVEHEVERSSSSKYGETLSTATSEGVDQSEGTTPTQSQYGETILTKTSEGVDQSEGGTLTATLF